MGTHDFKVNKLPPFARKSGNINVSRSAAAKLAFILACSSNCDVK